MLYRIAPPFVPYRPTAAAPTTATPAKSAQAALPLWATFADPELGVEEAAEAELVEEAEVVAAADF